MKEDLTSWLLNHYGKEVMRPGLSRMRTALEPILSSLKKCKIVTIAGTNGKGETALRLSQKLKGTPHLVWTSPHIERITERFRDEKGEISESELRSLIDRCHEDVARRSLELSYYEFLFLVFCTWAVEKTPKILCLEVGLGGRLDAVNVLDADLVLLPSISRDHQEFLGHRYDQILTEKLGVLRPGTFLLSGLSLNYLRERSSDFGQKIGAQVLHLDEVLPLPEFEFSQRNEFLAHAAFRFLSGASFAELKHGKDLACWHSEGWGLEHRGEVFQDKNTYVFFGSHNPDGVRKLIQFLRSGTYTFPRPPFDLVLLGFSKRNARDLESMVKMMKHAGLGKVVVTSFDHPKAIETHQAQQYARQEGLDFALTTDSLVHGKNDQIILVTGSYYFMSSVKRDLRRLSSAPAGR
jgi:dihydrofolate synthase / folylpolyglutamate synthase